MFEFGLQAWIYFCVFLIAALALDLFYYAKKEKTYSFSQAVSHVCFWVFLGLSFNVLIGFLKGFDAAFQFLGSYFIEFSLSCDNLFVFYITFKYFHIPVALQHRILFYGILGTLVLRLVFILAGISLIQHFHFLFYIFGAFLVLTGLFMFKKEHRKVDPSKNIVVSLLKKIIPFTDEKEGDAFFIKRNGKRYATIYFAIAIIIETSDIIFALDSIPAVFSITLDPYIAFTSNACAVLGLRALYFVLYKLVESFSYLHYGVCLVLIFAGLKMLLTQHIAIPALLSVLIIGAILGISIFASTHFHKGSK